MHSSIKNYFAITKKEWNGMLVLAALMILILVAPDVYQSLVIPQKIDFSRIKEAQRILNEAIEERPTYENNNLDHANRADASFGTKKLKPEYFSFNPNNLSDGLWKKLGLSERQIKVIKNYEAKGGKFYKKEDLQKIYSITSQDYARLEQYINIPEKKFSNNYPSTSSSYRSKPMVMVEINHADSAQLTAISGIGPAFANRILKYRNRLGGFYRKTQLLEVYGLDSAKYEEIEKQVVVDAAEIVKINTNTCDFDELKRNPYLNFKQMNAIIQYRKQHGNYKSISDLKNVAILSDDVIYKMEPYFSY
ncbi:MAG: helix-hairpin-helix domain-containing protein [Janthinobacterium lividum]